MLIVAGTFEVDPERREEFLLGFHEAMRASRAEPGCLEYTFSADPIEAGRVVLFERWSDQAALDAHQARLRAGPRAPRTVAPTSASILVYDVTGERRLGA